MRSIANLLQINNLNRLFSCLNEYLAKCSKTRTLALFLTIASTFTVLLTYFAISNTKDGFGPDLKNVVGLIIIDLTLILALAGVVSRRLIKLIVERRKGIVGSRLQIRIAVMFSLVAIVPTIIMTLSSVFFFNFGIQSWFDTKVSTAIDGSVAIAESYLEEHKKIITADIMGMANDLNRDAYNVRKNPRTFNQKVTLLASIRKIPEAIVFKKNTDSESILARTRFSLALQMILEDLSADIMKRAEDGELVTITNPDDDRVIAIVKLENYFDTYLLVGRFVDTNILNHIELTQGAASEYAKLKVDISNLQIKFFVVFLIVSLLLLLAAVWFGLIFSVDLVKPISSLISATQKVKEGDFNTSVEEGPENDEIATLGRAFNNMTSQLHQQKNKIISAERRAAWSDVARRIAHEIKNPLTPIQLAAERLKKKYSDQVADQQNYDRYLDTISRNVKDIGKMVEEFANFARMPAPKLENVNICAICSDTIFAREDNNPNIKYNFTQSDKIINVNADSGQLNQVFTNLFKNAEEAVKERIDENQHDDSYQGIINIELSKSKRNCSLIIEDNGNGFPENIIDNLTEPYVTTKIKGTGLGLAIVKKIIEDHNGDIDFYNWHNGARIKIILPLKTK